MDSMDGCTRSIPVPPPSVVVPFGSSEDLGLEIGEGVCHLLRYRRGTGSPDPGV